MTDVLERIKNEVAKEWFDKYSVVGPDKRYQSFKTLPIHAREDCLTEVCRRYALECCQATLVKASEKAIADVPTHPHLRATILKGSITDKENIVIL